MGPLSVDSDFVSQPAHEHGWTLANAGPRDMTALFCLQSSLARSGSLSRLTLWGPMMQHRLHASTSVPHRTVMSCIMRFSYFCFTNLKQCAPHQSQPFNGFSFSLKWMCWIRWLLRSCSALLGSDLEMSIYATSIRHSFPPHLKNYTPIHLCFCLLAAGEGNATCIDCS